MGRPMSSATPSLHELVMRLLQATDEEGFLVFDLWGEPP